jgi:hypothetical protein
MGSDDIYDMTSAYSFQGCRRGVTMYEYEVPSTNTQGRGNDLERSARISSLASSYIRAASPTCSRSAITKTNCIGN